MHRRLSKLIHQDLGQTLVRFVLRDLHIAGGKVLEDRFENIADRQGAGLRRQVTTHRCSQADRTVVDRLMAVEAVLGLRGHPYRVLRR
ncbi:hypothetical protein D9M73_227540 [compost metagenome]